MTKIILSQNININSVKRAAIMFHTDPVAALKSVTPVSQWDSVTKLATAALVDARKTPGIRPEQIQHETRNRLAQMFYEATGTAPEALGGQIAPSLGVPPATARQAALSAMPTGTAQPESAGVSVEAEQQDPAANKGPRIKAASYLTRSTQPTSKKESLKKKAAYYLGLIGL